MCPSPPEQAPLFDDLPLPAGHLPAGFAYAPGFLTHEEETALLALVDTLPLEAARYKDYTARRRVLGFGHGHDGDTSPPRQAEPLIPALHPLRQRVAEWAGLSAGQLVHTLVAEYAPGTPLGWHRDMPDFEDVFGVSLGSSADLRFRPYPPDAPKRSDIVRLQVAPRSVYALRGPARWAWQHSVAPVQAPRWSITFRTLRRV